MEQVQKEFNQNGLTVLAVNVQEHRDLVANWVEGKNVTSLILLDTDGAVAQLYGVTGTPTVVLIGRQGEMIGRAIGSREWTGKKGRGLFEVLLAPPAR
jgi:peroxiredoxin